MSSFLGKIQLGAQTAGRPPVAVEVAVEGVLAAAQAAAGQAPVFAFAPLPAGSVAPGIAEANLAAPDAVSAAIRTALDQVNPRSRAVTLILPDPAVRVFILDFDTLPTKAAETIPVLRFRLRKMVPFDVEHAGLSYQILTQTRDECRVLAVVIPGTVLDEYETAVRAAGYEPGVVLPSTLAALAAMDSLESVLSAHLSATSLTTTITSGQNLLLYRTLDLPADPAQQLEEVQRDIAVAAAYFEDALSARPQRLHYAGTGNADTCAQWLGLSASDEEFAVVDLAPRPATGATTPLGDLSLAALTGALAGVA